MTNKSWKVSVLARLIISFIIILIPIYGLGIYIYNNSLVILRKELSNSMISQVSYYLDNLENEVERIQLLQYELLNDTDINRMATISQALTNIERMDSLLRIRNRLLAIKNSSKYIKTSTVMLPDAGKEVTNTNVSDFDSEQYRKMESMAKKADVPIMHTDNSLYLIIPYPYSYTSSRAPIFLIQSELSKEEFESTLKAMVNSDDEGVALYNTKSGSIIATSYNNIFHEKIRQHIFDNSETLTGAKIVSIDGIRYLVAYKTSEFFDSILYKYVPEKAVFDPLKNFRAWFLVFSALSLTVIVIYSIYLYTFIHKPLNRLVSSFREVKKGNFDIHIEHEVDDEFRFIYRGFNSMVRDIKSLIDQTYTQKLLVQKAQMKQLQSQINPHFLYNSFFILNTMARTEDYENLEKFTEQLGRYFQFITRSAADEVTLQKEVEHARVYTEIQAMRYSNRIKVSFEELPEEFSEIMVPRLILQPLIENAFEHGLGMKKDNGLLTVSFEKNQEELHIIVENNGDDITEEKMNHLQAKLTNKNDNKDEVTALQNIHQRLKLKFGQKYGLMIDKGSMGGLKVTILLPYKQYRN